MMKITLIALSLCIPFLAHAKTAEELNKSRMTRTPSSDLYSNDKYVIGVVESSDALGALKKAYKNCKMTGITLAPPNEHLVPKTVNYTCMSKKDGKVEIHAATEVAGWGETSDITITVLGVAGATNE
jgi:hypothetical protein